MNSRNHFILIGVIITGITAGAFLSAFAEKSRPPLPAGYADQDLALQGARLKGFTLGFEGLLADWYWMQSLQYIGTKIIENSEANINIDDLSSLNPRLLYPYLDNATTLDPKFTAAYSYGAMVLPAIDAEKAVELTRKGIANNPREWRLYGSLGYIYWKLERYAEAAEAYAEGAKIEGAPDWMKLMAAKVNSEGGSRDTARIIYGQMAREAGDPQTKEIAELRLLQIEAFDELDRVRPALEDFKARTGRCPNDLKEIFPLLKTVKLPAGKEFRIDRADNLVDPTGEPYFFDKAKCDVRISLASKLPPN